MIFQLKKFSLLPRMAEITNKTLIQLMDKHRLSLNQVAEMLHVSPKTVQHWRMKKDATGYRRMPTSQIELLQFKLTVAV